MEPPLIRFAALALVAGLLAAHPSPARAESPSADLVPEAVAFVQDQRLGANLESMAIRVARGTHAYATLPAGSAEREIRRLLPKYQPRWDANLARAYARHLSPDELRSLAAQGSASPHAAKLRQVRPLVGDEMQRLSKPLLTELVVEAMKAAAGA